VTLNHFFQNKYLLYIYTTDTHQYLHASSCHVYHSKRAIPYSQALRLNRICSEPSFFDRRCNQLEDWLAKRGYKDSLVRAQVLKARKFKREDLLNRQRQERPAPSLVLNITYHPAFAKLKSMLSTVHLLLTPDSEHRNTFPNIPIVGFKRGKSLKDILVRARLPKVDKGEGKSSGCGGKRCGVCSYLKESNSFTDRNGKKFTIKSDLNCDSKNVVYLVSCKKCSIQYVGSASTAFRYRFNNYRCCYRKHSSGSVVPQATFHAHFAQDGHRGMEDWEFTLIDQAENLPTVRRRETFWQHKLNSFSPLGLNERNVTLDYG